MEDYQKKLSTFLSENGFIWGPEPEIYGGIAGFYTYGPLGKLLKNQVENNIRKVFQANNFWEVECPIIQPKAVWEASGHYSSFTDPLIKCTNCKADLRVDKLIEEQFQEIQVGGMKKEDLLKLIKEKHIVCPLCNGNLEKEIKDHSLMMRTTIGTDIEAYNRPETATTSYLPFPRYTDFFRKKTPFGVFQIGKVFRNEISPRQSVTRGREFTQAEGQLFLFKHQKDNFEKFEIVKTEELPLWSEEMQKNGELFSQTSLQDAIEKKYFKTKAYAWIVHLAHKLFLEMGIPPELIRFRQHHHDEKAFYAQDAWDLEVKTESFGWMEMVGIHDRGDYDLKQHAEFSKKKLEIFDEETKEKLVPHVLEIAFGTDRPTYALLDIFYDPSNDERRVFRIPARLAPIQVGIYPLVKKDKLPQIAKEIYEDLRKEFICVIEESSSIGKRYARNDEAGTAFGITVDFDSITNEDVTLRERDSQKQIRIKISDLGMTIRGLVDGSMDFNKIF